MNEQKERRPLADEKTSLTAPLPTRSRKAPPIGVHSICTDPEARRALT